MTFTTSKTKALTVFMALAVTATLTCSPMALASTRDNPASVNEPTAIVDTTNDFITAAATRAAMPSLEILGAASVEESGNFIDTSNYFNWSQPKYILAASLYNEEPSPFLANLGTGLSSVTYPAAVLNASRGGGGSGPDTALAAYTVNGVDNAVWDLYPAVIVGDGNGVSYTANGYAPTGKANYSPIGVDYSFSDYTSLCNTMDAIAIALDTANAADSSRTLRFGSSATSIAQSYRKYIFGTMGYIQKMINEGKTSLRTVALVENAWYNTESQSYVFDLMTDAEAVTTSGTAAINRYLETTSTSGLTGINIATNYGNTHATASAEELESVDLIMVGGQQSSSYYDNIVKALFEEDLFEKTYFVENNGSAGAMYGVVMNSVENAQNIGRILGCLYSDVIDQQSWLAYYYEEFYHIDENSLETVMDNALDGVRNWSIKTSDAETVEEAIVDFTEWDLTTDYTSNYCKKKVQDAISDGYTYYTSLVSNSSSSGN